MKKTFFVIPLTAILVILNACAAPSTTTAVYLTQTPASTPTAIPPTPTSLPPTPALEGLLLSGETLSTTTDGVPRYALTNAGWEPIPPEDLSDELANLEGWDYAQSEQGALQIVDLEGNPLWIEISGLWIQLSADLPEGWQLVNDGKNIVDADGTPVPWMRLEDGKMIIDIRLSLDKAKQAVAETISIKGDYGYNEKGGVVSMFDDEKGDWIPFPFGEEDLKKLASMQWVKWPFYLYGEDMIVIKVHEYGEPNLANPNEGAKIIRNASGEIVAYVLLSVDAIKSNGQIAEIPVILYRADKKKIVIFSWIITNNLEHQWFEALTTWYLPREIYKTLATEEKALYDNPDEWDRIITDKKPQLGRGDIIGTDYLREGFTSLAQDIYNLNETLGITLSDLNDPEGFAKYLETGDITFLNDDDLILIMLLPDGVRMIRDTVNQ